MKCQRCKTSINNDWDFCPSCGVEVSQKPNLQVVESSTGGTGTSPYSQGVRAQVFEVIVRQAMAGAPWKEICAGPMLVNNISADGIEAEVNRRQRSISGIEHSEPSSSISASQSKSGELIEINFRPTSKTLVSLYDSILDISDEELYQSKKALAKQKRVLENLADLIRIVEKLEQDEMKG